MSKARERLLALVPEIHRPTFKLCKNVPVPMLWESILIMYGVMHSAGENSVGKDFTDGSDAKYSTLQRMPNTCQARVLISGLSNKIGTLRFCLSTYNEANLGSTLFDDDENLYFYKIPPDIWTKYLSEDGRGGKRISMSYSKFVKQFTEFRCEFKEIVQ